MAESQNAKKVEPWVFQTGRQLQTEDIPPMNYMIDEILPEGLSILIAPPKSGKSWIALGMCEAVAMGKRYLGFETTPCDVIYLALEDIAINLKDRQQKLLGDGVEAPENLRIVYQSERLSNLTDNSGFIEQLKLALEAFSDTKFIVIDMFAQISATDRRQGNAYEADSNLLNALKNICRERHITILIVHHTAKNGESQNGSTGLVGIPDTILKLSKEGRNGTLSISGRYIPNQDIQLIQSDIGIWERNGIKQPQKESDFLRKQNTPLIKFALEMTQFDEYEFTPTQFVEACKARYGSVEPSIDKLRNPQMGLTARILKMQNDGYLRALGLEYYEMSNAKHTKVLRRIEQ